MATHCPPAGRVLCECVKEKRVFQNYHGVFIVKKRLICYNMGSKFSFCPRSRLFSAHFTDCAASGGNVRYEIFGSNMKAIEFTNVSFRYEDDSPFVIDKLNFSVEEGEFVAVLGHNGSGKSTLARLSNGLLIPDAGTVSVFGVPLTDKTLFDARKNVGVVFQNPDNQTVATIVEDDVAFGAENVGLPREEIGKRIDFALRAVGMQDYRNATVARLSGGQKQRIAIAGVLALKPRAVILDESTAMLDPRGRREIVDVVTRLNKEEGITVVLITHFMEEALLADRAVVMNRGEIVMQGAPAEIFERQEELVTYNLALPRIGIICNRLRAAGMPVENTLDAEKLAEEIARCV